MQMNGPNSQFDLLETNLQRLSARIPELPVPGILLCRLIMHMGREMAGMLEQEIRPVGLAEAEFRVLTALFSQPDGVTHPSDLCMQASQSPANMSRISDALVSRNLITRELSVQDRRRMVLKITEQGEALVRSLLPKMAGSLREMLLNFPEAEQRDLVAQLKRFRAALDSGAAQELPERLP